MISFVSVNGVATSHYEYDLNSNRVKSVLGSNTKLATFDAQDRLKDFASNQYLFNLRGQLLERTDSSTPAKTKYTYNAFGDLKSVVLPNQIKIDYLIDGEHHRVGRMLNGNLDRYYGFDAEGRVLYERQPGAGGVFRLYIYLPQSHSPDAFLDGNTGVYYKLIKDHLGSIRLVINSNNGLVFQELDYDEWGQVIKDTNPGFQLFGFAGGVYDKDTKLVRFGARDYDAETGRWTAKDPLLFGGGDTNLYSYVANNPMSYIDPSGDFAVEIGVGFLTQVGLLGGGAAKNVALSFNFSTGQWQVGTTTNVQGNIGGGLYGGVGGQLSVTPGAGSLCDLNGTSVGVGGAAGVGLAGGSGQITVGSAGPTLSVGLPRISAGAGVAGFGVISNTSVQVTNQGNIYNWFKSAVGF